MLHTHTHTQPFYGPFFQDYPDELVQEEIIFCAFMVQGKITEAYTPTIRLGATPSGLISDRPLSSPPFLCQTPFLLQLSPTLSWLGSGTKYAGLHTQWHGFDADVSDPANQNPIACTVLTILLGR